MLTAVHAKSKLDEVISNYTPAGRQKNALEDGNHSWTVNDVVSLKQGVIKKPNNKTKAPYTILLVGEAGVGKSSFLELIANVVSGNDIGRYNFNILDHTNEQGHSHNQSRTNSARLYELTSQNGIVVRILDTPGLVDTRDPQRDELHMKKVASQIKQIISSVTVVLVLANGTIPHITVGTDYALSILSAIFPKPLTNNIALLSTNVQNLLQLNLSEGSIPDILKAAPQFLLDNPIALQKKYLKLEKDPSMKNRRSDLRDIIKDGEQGALEMLVELFDWLDSLEPQPTLEIVPLYMTSENNNDMVIDTLAPIDQAAVKGLLGNTTSVS